MKGKPRKPKDLSARAGQMLQILERRFPEARCRLEHRDALELLVATILAAQCTDEKVNEVTSALFQKYRTAADYAGAKPEAFEREIRPTGFYRNKTRSVIAAGKALVARHDGAVPDTMEALVDLPGVGRKTANVVLGNVFGKPAIIVDTHFKRVMDRTGLSHQKDPDKIEAEICEIISPRDRTAFSHVVNFHGRLVCQARKPKCADCGITHLCDYYAAP